MQTTMLILKWLTFWEIHVYLALLTFVTVWGVGVGRVRPSCPSRPFRQAVFGSRKRWNLLACTWTVRSDARSINMNSPHIIYSHLSDLTMNSWSIITKQKMRVCVYFGWLPHTLRPFPYFCDNWSNLSPSTWCINVLEFRGAIL